MVGISVDAFTEHVPEFVKEFGMSYPVLLDPDDEVRGLYGVRGLPETFLIGPDGRIHDRWLGYDEEIGRLIRSAVTDALAGKETP